MSCYKNHSLLTEITPAYVHHESTMRLMVILRTNGCSYAKETGGCYHCSLISNAIKSVEAHNLKMQFDNAITANIGSNYKHLDLLVLGSFFDDKEIPNDVLEYIFTRIAKGKNIESVLIETRPEYITSEKIRKSKELLGEVKLEIAIGIESTNDYIRETILNKGYGMKELTKAVITMSKLDVDFLGYVLIKPVGISEKKAIEDAISTIKDIFDLGKKYGVYTRVAIQPYYVARKSKSYIEYKKGNYKPPMYWSIIEIIKATNQFGDILVALNDEGLSDGINACNCELCRSLIVEKLKNYNYTNDISELQKIECKCIEGWKNRLLEE